jgi:hypothetical protein
MASPGRVAPTWLAILVVLGLFPLWADAFGLSAPRIGLDRPSVRLGALSRPHKVRVVAEVREAMGWGFSQGSRGISFNF